MVLFLLFVATLRRRTDSVRISISLYGHRMEGDSFMRCLGVLGGQEAGGVVR